MNSVLSICIGIGLSATCGFRIFVPMLGISIAALSGNVTLSSGFEWIGTWPALVAFTVAMFLEIGAYYIPVFDNFMDTITTPAAVVAGIIVTAAMVSDMSPFLKWSLAIIAGGGAAGLFQGCTVGIRAGAQSSAPIVATPVVTTVETSSAIFATVLAFVDPVIFLVFLIGACWLMIVLVRRLGAGIKGLFSMFRPHRDVRNST